MRRLRSLCSSALRFFSYTKAKSKCDLRQRKAYVVFGPVDLIWPHKFLAPGFKHCYVFWESECGILQLDAAINIATVSWLGKGVTVDRYIAVLHRLGCRVIECTIKPDRIVSQYIPRLGTLNCVSLTKLALGIKPFWVYTPKQLFKYLMKSNKEIDMGGGDNGASQYFQEKMAQEQEDRAEQLQAEAEDKNKQVMSDQLKQMRRMRGSTGGAQGGSNTSLGG